MVISFLLPILYHKSRDDVSDMEPHGWDCNLVDQAGGTLESQGGAGAEWGDLMVYQGKWDETEDAEDSA